MTYKIHCNSISLLVKFNCMTPAERCWTFSRKQIMFPTVNVFICELV